VHNRWMPMILLALVGLAFLAPLPAFAQAAPGAPSDAALLEDYSQRDASANGLEDFAGGHAGLIVLIVVLAAAIIILAILIPW
jgi:hypothetical protein